MSDPSADPPDPARRRYATAHLANLSASIDQWSHPERISHYHILEVLGEGGMGTVYKAEQRTPLHRIVAIKLIKLGMDTREVVSRFQAERQALAVMEHPNVARVIDAGATIDGRPYFVMEYVPGSPITDFADAEKLTIEQRLRLFTQACDAVQHAHQKAIIHRDLKPSNILVMRQDSGPVVKVIDFGVAKALDQHLTEKTLFTETGQFLGTPEYMSPEQADGGGRDVDTRTDVYSLGAVLYELLTGAVPFDGAELRSKGFNEIQRIIREVDPPRPSTRLSAMGERKSTVASLRQIPVEQLERTFHRELDWIPLKALRKDRNQRYATPSELAEDIHNYIEHRPLLAGPESATYRLAKFLRRNRIAVVSATLVLGCLVLATAVSVTFWLRERDQLRATQAAKSELEKVARFQESQFAAIDLQDMGVRIKAGLLEESRAASKDQALSASEREARDVALQELVRRADFAGIALESFDKSFFQPTIAAIDKEFADQPAIQARLLDTMATTMRGLGLLTAAYEPQERALNIRRRELGEDDAKTMESVYGMGMLLMDQGKLPQAEEYLQKAVDGFRRAVGDEHESTLVAQSSLALLFERQGKLEAAEALLRETLSKQRRTMGAEHLETLLSINNLAAQLEALGKPAEAEVLLRECVDVMSRVHGPMHRRTSTSMLRLGSVLMAQGKYDDAEPHIQRALENFRQTLGNDNLATQGAMGNLGLLLRNQGKFSDAEAVYRELLDIRLRVLGGEHTTTLTVKHNLAALLLAEGKLQDAESLFRQCYESRRRQLDADHPDLLVSMSNLGRVLTAQHRLAEAEPYCRESLERYRRVMGDEHPDTLIAIRAMGTLLVEQGKPADAIALLEPSESASRQKFTKGRASRLGLFLTSLGRARTGVGQFSVAEANLTEAMGILSRATAGTDQDRAAVVQAMVELQIAWDKAEPAKGHDTRAAQLREQLQKFSSTTQPTTRPTTRPAVSN